MTFVYRPGTAADSFAAFQIFREAVMDLGQRQGVAAVTGGGDPGFVDELWEQRRPLFEHLAASAEHFWLAEQDGQLLGYARSTLRDGLRELTELFVRPGAQSLGVGRELLARAFPTQGAKRRVIIATTDVRALVRYLKSGVYAHFPIYNFSRSPGTAAVPGDLGGRPVSGSPEEMEELRAIDLAVLGHTRDVDHAWLLSQRRGYLYRQAGRIVGYGYVAEDAGPFALLDPALFPAVLAHAAGEAAGLVDRLYLEVPLVNRHAVDYLLREGYHMSAFTALFMSDEPFGRFENYIFTSPPFFL
jgi:GNAT superfamily N-acetyltransferase